ncbi:hypothetical protein K5M73_05260 [Streptomonospora halotolerans]|nr:DUF6879 family protein [Streptomonospora nanhaiensis]MBX9387651.1 hypothetical protein [Streptomonospora nanhaiensis]
MEYPLTPYVRYELCSHRVAAQCGYRIGVLDAARIRHLEKDAQLPEAMVYSRVVYRIAYDHLWTPVGATRIDDPVLARSAAQTLGGLWRHCTPVTHFVP